MSRIIRLLARTGIVLTNPFHPVRAYQRPRPGDARNDFARISTDMRRVGSDLRQVADKEIGRYVRK